MRRRDIRADGYIRGVRLERDAPTSGYPFDLPVVNALAKGVDFGSGVTFLVGENGSGKSTLVEALAVAYGFNPEGGSENFNFATRASESELGNHLIVAKSGRRPRTRYFLRAESYYNVATEIEELDRAPSFGPPLINSYGGVSPHERSHGESFIDLITHRFGPGGLYLLDEPEAALSVRGCMAVLARMAELAARDSQFIVATHSPILLALPGASILELDDDGEIHETSYDKALPVRLTREFVNDPDVFLRHLLES
ncbi:AAA family ATPase [Nocardia huaxiensis]|uniref:AAA family ATPase n=1 Tax=Nocardia huaxiensis TaxID=2755382 RepID=A0A7D6VCQ9_9NOCA|nr:AAA family ATPase [Nocardia huaxiensis]QLY33321.1 AAA family ATPase [Nocardia huaxiensis]UFS99774.1 AAA family ATPase [Nocardia huaxiensis]